jgi:hypothetical protein
MTPACTSTTSVQYRQHTLDCCGIGSEIMCWQHPLTKPHTIRRCAGDQRLCKYFGRLPRAKTQTPHAACAGRQGPHETRHLADTACVSSSARLQYRQPPLGYFPARVHARQTQAVHSPASVGGTRITQCGASKRDSMSGGNKLYILQGELALQAALPGGPTAVRRSI